MKTCLDCKITRPLSEYYRVKRLRLISPYCKPCHMARTNNTRSKFKERYKWQYLQQKYGITQSEYEILFLHQDGLCAICQCEADKLLVDHDHSTGKIRGLLCDECNKALGLLRDNPEYVLRAANYLKAHAESAEQSVHSIELGSNPVPY